jgi:hypothetical protein
MTGRRGNRVENDQRTVQKRHERQPVWAADRQSKPSHVVGGADAAVAQLLAGEGPQLIRKAFELANKGNVQALRLCLDRVYPIPKERSIELDLPVAKNGKNSRPIFRMCWQRSARAASHPAKRTS